MSRRSAELYVMHGEVVRTVLGKIDCSDYSVIPERWLDSNLELTEKCLFS